MHKLRQTKRKQAQKISLTVPVSKPRNPLVALARLRKAGMHVKTEKAQRAIEKAQLKKSLANL